MKAVLLELLQLAKKFKLALSSLLPGDNGREQLLADGKVDLMFLNLSTRLSLVN